MIYNWTVFPNIGVKMNDEVIGVVVEFIFLGYNIDCSGSDTPEIKRRLAMRRDAMLTSSNLTEPLPF